MAWSDAARAAAAEARRLHYDKGLKIGTARSIALSHVSAWPLTGSMRLDRASWIRKVRGKLGPKKGRKLIRAADNAAIVGRR